VAIRDSMDHTPAHVGAGPDAPAGVSWAGQGGMGGAAGSSAAGIPTGGLRTTRSSLWGITPQKEERVASALASSRFDCHLDRGTPAASGSCPPYPAPERPAQRTADRAHGAGWPPPRTASPVRVVPARSKPATQPAPRASAAGCARPGLTTRQRSRETPPRVSLSSCDTRPAVDPGQAGFRTSPPAQPGRGRQRRAARWSLPRPGEHTKREPIRRRRRPANAAPWRAPGASRGARGRRSASGRPSAPGRRSVRAR